MNTVSFTVAGVAGVAGVVAASGHRFNPPPPTSHRAHQNRETHCNKQQKASDGRVITQLPMVTVT